MASTWYFDSTPTATSGSGLPLLAERVAHRHDEAPLGEHVRRRRLRSAVPAGPVVLAPPAGAVNLQQDESEPPVVRDDLRLRVAAAGEVHRIFSIARSPVPTCASAGARHPR